MKRTNILHGAVSILLVLALVIIPISPVWAGGTQLPPTPPGVNIPGLDTINLALELMQAVKGGDCPNWKEVRDDLAAFIAGKVFASMGPVGAGIWFAKEAGKWSGEQVNSQVIENGFYGYERVRDSYLKTQGLDPGGKIPESKWMDFINMMTGPAGSADRLIPKTLSYVNRGNVNEFSRLSTGEMRFGIAMLEFMHMNKVWREQNLSTWDQMSDWLSDLIYGDPLPMSFEDIQNDCGGKKGGAATVLAAWDPNAIEADPTGRGDAGWIAPNQRIDYTIFFENDPDEFGEFTIAAEDVWIKLTLDPALDPATVEFGESSYENTQVSLDPESGQLHWGLPGISLPPNHNAPEGEGWVKFSVSPKAGLRSGTEITATAAIIFDFNPAIETNTVKHTIDSEQPSASMQPLADAHYQGNILLEWTGSDNSGIREYTLYRSLDDGPLTVWQTTANNSLTFAAEGGHSYGFAVQAEDLAGNKSAAPLSPELSFQVLTPNSSDTASTGNTSVRLAKGKLILPEGLSAQQIEVKEYLNAADIPQHVVLASRSATAVKHVFRLVTTDGTIPAAPVQFYPETAAGEGLYRYDPHYRHLVPVKTVRTSIGEKADLIRAGTYVVQEELPRDFSDMEEDRWSASYIQALARKGLLEGFSDGSFRPTHPLTREQAAKVVNLAGGIAGQAPAPNLFPDIGGRWSEVFIYSGYRAELFTGYPDGTFQPDSPVTRAELVVMVLRALNIEPAGEPDFLDTTGYWAAPYIAAGVQAGFLQGYADGTFRPEAHVTREETAKIAATAFGWTKAK